MLPLSSSQASSQSSSKKPKAPTSKPTRPRTVKLGAGPSTATQGQKRVDPLNAFSQFTTSATPTPPPSSDSSSSRKSILTPHVPSRKGKAKAPVTAEDVDYSLWVDRYEPQEEGELAVHVRKVEDVRRWLQEAFEGGPSGKLSKYRRILVLTGPAGTGKTTTLRILARNMGFDVLEWKTSAESPSASGVWSTRDPVDQPQDYDIDYENSFSRFEAFLSRATSCQTIFTAPSSAPKRVVLLEDLPNILHSQIQTQFHATLHSFVSSPPSNPPIPMVIILSDAGLRGEARDERLAGGRGWGKDKDQTLDIRTVLPRDLLSGPYVTEIGFNPIAPTLLKKALQAMLNKHFSTNSKSKDMPSQEVLDMIVSSANGDIRSAIMALQFACIIRVPNPKKRARGTQDTGAGSDSAVFVMESVTRREQSLALFHMLGKVLYNKRKGDPPAASATAKDVQRDKDLDASLVDSRPLPGHLKHHERRPSRVDVNTLYADSPIDSSLFSLYIHQNYIPFCLQTEEVEEISDWLSYVDSSGGDAWYQSNPYQFHLLALGTLHSLPAPVPRRSQKYFKPEFFHYHQTQSQSMDAIRRVRDWVTNTGVTMDNSGWRAGGWSNESVAMELGGILKARDASTPTMQPPTRNLYFKPPTGHRTFSKMQFVWGQTGFQSAQLNENDDATSDLVIDQLDEEPGNKVGMHNKSKSSQAHLLDDDATHGGWLSSDDIEDFD